MSRMTILFLDHATALGGAEHSLLLLLKHLDRQRFSLHLVCPEGRLATAARELAVPVHPLNFPRLRRSSRFARDAFHGAQEIGRLARRVGAQALYSNTVRATLYGVLAARFARLPLVWHMRDFWLTEAQPRRRWLDRWGKRLLCELSTQVVANSQAVAALLPCPQRVRVILNGIEIECFDPTIASGEAFRQQMGIPSAAPVVGMVGRLRPWKGQEAFLRAAALVRREHVAAHFLVVGGDPFQSGDEYASHLRQLALNLGLGARVSFTGQLEDVRPALAAMNVFVHPGQPEPFGLVNIEAMAMAKPVVAFAHGALPEIVVDGETGLLVPPQDLSALARGIALLLSRPERASAMGAAGRVRAVNLFHIRRTVAELESLLSESH